MAIAHDFEVQVRTGRATSAADKADELTFLYLNAWANTESKRGQMAIDR